MDPISVIVAALAAGAGAGVKDTMSQAVQDAYGGLRELVGARLARRSEAGRVLLEHRASQEWQELLAAELAAVNAGSDEQIVAAAQEVLELRDPVGTREGKYRVDARGAQGVQVGDHNIQSNTFATPPTE